MKTIRNIYLLIAALALVNLGLGNPGVSLVKEGNRLFGEGKYDQALAKYTEAQLELPESPEIYYNIGGAQYEKSDYEKAGALFKKIAESKDRALAARAGYNLGNTLFRAGDYQAAAAAYKATLKLNPEDADAKYNYELALLKLKEQQQEQEKKGEEEKEDEEKEEEEEEEKPDDEPDPNQPAGVIAAQDIE